MKGNVPFTVGRISEIAQMIGRPDAQRYDQVAIHRCYWACGCEAVNNRGLCYEDGWSFVPCKEHPAAGIPNL